MYSNNQSSRFWRVSVAATASALVGASLVLALPSAQPSMATVMAPTSVATPSRLVGQIPPGRFIRETSDPLTMKETDTVPFEAIPAKATSENEVWLPRCRHLFRIPCHLRSLDLCCFL